MRPGAPLDGRLRTGGVDTGDPHAFRGSRPEAFAVTKRQSRPPGRVVLATTGDHPFGKQWGWDREITSYSDFDLPTYVGPATFSKLPWITEPAELAARGVDA